MFPDGGFFVGADLGGFSTSGDEGGEDGAVLADSDEFDVDDPDVLDPLLLATAVLAVDKVGDGGDGDLAEPDPPAHLILRSQAYIM